MLVGGFGTRLRPLTLHTPKQMLPVMDRPMIEWVLEHLAAHGIDDAVLSLGYRPDAFQDAYPDGRCAGVALHYAVEPEPLDTAGAIRFAAREAGIDERVVVVNGDVLTDLDIGALLAFHDRAGAEATITLHRVHEPSRYGVVPTDDDGRVLAFVEKPPPGEAPTDLINAGTYVLEQSVLARIPEGRRVSIERETFPAMVEDRTLFAMDDGGVYWLDAGTPETYLEAQLDLVGGRRSAPVAAVDSSACIGPGATVENAVVLRDVVVGAGVTVRGSALLPGSSVGKGAMVLDSIVGPGAVVGVGAVVSEMTVLGDGAVVLDGEILIGARVPEAEETK
ncbi:MAG: mannose-phosphate guanylyltransferase [Acidimicrobiaceae bacterium]